MSVKRSTAPGAPRVLTLVGTRPELIKLSRVIALLDAHTDHTFIHTGQNFDFELNEIFYEELELRRPDRFLGVVKDPKQSAMQTIANTLVEVDTALEILKPDAVLLYGDTNSCLAAISVKKRKIPLFHMEAGNRSFDARVPEELNRKIVDHLADINFTNSERARLYLEREGLPPDSIVMSGSPMLEILHFLEAKIKNSTVLSKLSLARHKYFVVSLHREENVDSPEKLDVFLQYLAELTQVYQLPVIFSAHPRTRRRLEENAVKNHNPLIRIMNPLGFVDYIALQLNSLLTISDSGTVTEESSCLGFRAITPRASHERPEGTDSGVLIKSPMAKQALMHATRTAIALPVPKMISDYSYSHVSEIVVKTILSSIDKIQRTNWFKNSF